MNENKQPTSVYTFKVDMTVEIIAKSATEARNTLDSQGGFVSRRTVDMLNTVELPTREKLDKDTKDA